MRDQCLGVVGAVCKPEEQPARSVYASVGAATERPRAQTRVRVQAQSCKVAHQVVRATVLRHQSSFVWNEGWQVNGSTLEPKAENNEEDALGPNAKVEDRYVWARDGQRRRTQGPANSNFPGMR